MSVCVRMAVSDKPKLCVALVGAGAFGQKHLEAISAIDDAEVCWLVGPDEASARSDAARFGIANATASLERVLDEREVDAVILCTPTPLHAEQAVRCLEAGKHVLVEIPMGDSLAGAASVVRAAGQRTGLVAMCGHTRRFNPSHQWVHRRIEDGSFNLQQLNVHTYFMRRTNTNAMGLPRTWTDHLLWHHAAHTVDLFRWQSGSDIVHAHALQGPTHPVLGIAMDMSIQLASRGGALCTLSLSFNNAGPFGSVFRYIGDSGTYVASYDELADGDGNPIDVRMPGQSMNGIEIEDREFFAAIREGRQPQASVKEVLPCYEILDRLESSLARQAMPDYRQS